MENTNTTAFLLVGAHSRQHLPSMAVEGGFGLLYLKQLESGASSADSKPVRLSRSKQNPIIYNKH